MRPQSSIPGLAGQFQSKSLKQRISPSHNNNPLIHTNHSNQQQFIRKYSPQTQLLNKCLPAKFSHQQIYGQLLIKFQSLILHSNMAMSKSKNIIYRCRMLGYSQDQSPFLSQNINYTIHTNNKMFKHYLKDMRLCLVEVLDSRNYQPLGHAYINWLTYMRSIQDYQLIIESKQEENQYQTNPINIKKYYLPFLDEECQIKVPVFDFRNQKVLPKSPSNQNQNQQEKTINTTKNHPKQRIIGQLSIRFMSRIYEHPIAPGYQSDSIQNIQRPIVRKSGLIRNSQLDFIQNDKNQLFKGPGSYLQIPQSNHQLSNNVMISSKSISPSNNRLSNDQQQKYSSIAQNTSGFQYPQLQRQASNFSSQNQKIFKNDNKSGLGRQNISNNYINKNDSLHFNNRIYKANGTDFNNQQNHNRKSSDYQSKSKQISLTPSTHELQLLQLKLDVQQFLQKDLTQQQQNRKKSQKIIMQIVKLRSKLQNITQLDVYLMEIQQEEQNDVNKQNLNYLLNKPHMKVYKISNQKNKNQDIFKSKVIIERANQRIIQVHLPNNQGKCTFRCKDLTGTNSQICVYNKGMIVGMLTIKKQQIDQKHQFMSTVMNVGGSNLKNQQNTNVASTYEHICIFVIDNFKQYFNKGTQQDISHLDNYSIGLKNVRFYQQCLISNKSSIGQYAITNTSEIPKIFALEVKNSQNQFVGMSQNINFEGSNLQVFDKNIMPMLVCQQNESITLKSMPAFKKLPNSISFRLSLYIANTTQLNYFITKWKQNADKNRRLVGKEKTISGHRTIVSKKIEKIGQNRNTISIGQQLSYQKQQGYNLHSDSQNLYQNKRLVNKDRNNTQSKSSELPQALNQRFKTQGNYTQDLHSQNKHQNTQKYSQKQEQLHSQEQQIYLVQFFCKSLHFILSKLGSRKNIDKKITELKNYQFSKSKKQSRNISVQIGQHEEGNSTVHTKGTVSKQQFERILSLLIGDNKKQVENALDFDLNEILEALFSVDSSQMINLEEFTLCLMAYYNFLLLLNNEKNIAFKQLLSCERSAEQKLQKIHKSMTNINSQFLWEDILPNVIQKTRKRINKRYRINPNTPFSVGFLLKQLQIYKKSQQNNSDQSLFIQLLNILHNSKQDQNKLELFIRTTADLGCLVRETVEQIIFAQNLIQKNNQINKNWLDLIIQKLQIFIKKQTQENFQSISDETRRNNEFCFNLTQFQQFISVLNVQMSIWESLMLIEEIKVWHQNDDFKDKNVFDLGEGVISVHLIKAWFNALYTKMKFINQRDWNKKQLNGQNSRLKSVRSVDSEEQDLIEQINKKLVTNKINQPATNKIKNNSVEQNDSIFKHYGLQNNERQRKKTQKNSLRQSQMNNESDIANIANLLRENENNLFFLPSMADPKTLNKITSGNINLSDQNILKGLDQNTLRNHIDGLNSKQRDQKSNQREYVKQKISENEIEQDERGQQRIDKVNIEPQYCYLSVKIKQIKLKNKQKVTDKQGLKKLTLSLKRISRQILDDLSSPQEQNSHTRQHYFLTSQTVQNIFNSSQQRQKDLQKYKLSNIKIDVNNLHRLQTLFNQGLCFQISNLSKKTQEGQKGKYRKKEISTDIKNQQLLVSGILPIQDVSKVAQQFKKLMDSENNNLKNNEYTKKKTIVLYSGRQMNGKVIVQLSFTNDKILEIKNNQRDKSNNYATNYASISLLFKKNELSNNKNKKNNIKGEHLIPELMSLSYCSIRQQQKLIQLLPAITYKQNYQIHLPQPIIQYQLILKTIAPPLANNNNQSSQIKQPYQNQSLMGLSRYSRLQNQTNHVIQEAINSHEQCVIPLQTLFFKKSITQEYPMLNQQTGRFICSVQAQMKIIQTQKQPNQEQEQDMSNPQYTNQNQQQKSQQQEEEIN